MIFPHTSPTYQARAKDHAGSLANFGSFIHLGIGITPPDKKGGDKRKADLFNGTEVGLGKRDAPPRVECRDHTPAAAAVNCNRLFEVSIYARIRIFLDRIIRARGSRPPRGDLRAGRRQAASARLEAQFGHVPRRRQRQPGRGQASSRSQVS